MSNPKYKGEIEYDIWLQASKNWDRYRGIGSGHDWPKWGHEFETFFGWNGYHTEWFNYPNTVRVPIEAIAKLRMMVSPHFRTLLKAYEIKHGVTVYSSEQHTDGS